MKSSFILAALAVLLLSNSECNKQKEDGTRYRGKLEIDGICMNYTISVQEGTLPAGSVAASWTDETTSITYRQVFRLGNPCDFPPNIKKGDTFYFTISREKEKECAVCMAYYPTPAQKVNIKVVP